MIKSAKFENFRGFSHLEMEDMKPVTLISGMNNIGKSSLLDGFFLFFDHIAPESFVKLNNFRGFPSLTEPKYLWEPLFHNLETRSPVRIQMELSAGVASLCYERDDAYVVPKDADVPQNILNQFISTAQSFYTLKFQYSYNGYWEAGHFISSPSGLLRNVDTSLEGNQIQFLPHTQFINSVIIQANSDISPLLGSLELEGKKEELIEILKLIEPSITDITTIMTASNAAQVYSKAGGRLLPVKLSGDGLNKLMFIVISIIANPNSLILIDEIETGIHYSAYVDFWKAIALTAQKYHCQIIATTHSYECITGAADGLENAGLSDRFCYFRLDRTKKGITVCRYSDKLLRMAVDTGWEVR